MSKESSKVENTFKVIEMMEKMRDVLRKTAPVHNLTPSEHEEALKIVAKAKEYLGKLEEQL